MNDEFDLGLGDVVPAVVVEEPRRVIIIDEVEGQPNYETVGVNGVVYQIQRGLETSVPLSVVNVLRNCIATKLVKVKREDGVEDTQKRTFSPIPWRLVG
jgi:hypothetical protein